MLLYGNILKEKFKQHNHTGKSELTKTAQEIARQNQRLKNARDLMLDGEISSGEYKEMRFEIEEKLAELSKEEMKFKEGIENHSTKIDDCLDLIQNIDKYYVAKDTPSKQRIVGSIFPEKLIFENNEYRTPKVNSVIGLLCRNSKVFKGNENEKNLQIINSSHRVTPEGFEPPTNRTGICHSIQLNYGAFFWKQR